MADGSNETVRIPIEAEIDLHAFAPCLQCVSKLVQEKREEEEERCDNGHGDVRPV